jgi:hypothetical protein
MKSLEVKNAGFDTTRMLNLVGQLPAALENRVAEKEPG